MPPTQTPGSTTTTTTPNDWTSGLNDELKGYVSTKGFKDVSTLVDSFRGLERLRGAPPERLLTLPEKADDPNWVQVWDRLGRPKETNGYNLEVPEKWGDPAFSDWAKKTFHGLNLTKEQGEGLNKAWNGYIQNKMNSDDQARTDQLASQKGALEKEWGAAFSQNSMIADRAVNLFGEKAQTVLKAVGEAVGWAEGMKILHTLGTKLGEDSFVSSQTTSNAFNRHLTPNEARSQINARKEDKEFMRRYLDGDTRAKDEMLALHQYLVGG